MSRLIGACRARVALARHRLRRALITLLPPETIEPLAIAAWRIRSLVDAGLRAKGAERCETARHLLAHGSWDAMQVSAGRWLEHLIDQRIYFGRLSRGREAWPDLQAVAGTLARTIGRLKADAPGCPVIVSPFHYVSQYANIYVIDELRALLGLESIAVVSGVPRDLYGDDHAQIPGVRVLYTYGDDNRNGLGLRVARTLRRSGVAVLFADVPPFTMHRFPMETVSVSMFGRDARIHNGVFRLGTQFDALLLPFYLRFERGRFSAEVLDPMPLAGGGAPQRLAGQIEAALNDNYARSLVTGHPAMYAFAPGR
ncbi:MAG TPA: hypothetical protein VEI25_06595 [Paraburkholderia sp.]|nr:hypothetical protein [Paraburkholderia sp.]